MNGLEPEQRRLCARLGAAFAPSLGTEIAGVARSVGFGLQPIHGLRHPATPGTTGWYIWAGDYSPAADFFEPLHVDHLRSRAPEVLRYLGLAPGWRFLIAPNYEDVWFDPSLLTV